MNRIKLWPHGALIVLAFAVVAGVAAVLFTKYERRAQASSLPNAARIERVDGQVGINQTATNNGNQSQWTEATVNTPLAVGDRIYTKQNSRTEVAFTGRNFATIDQNTSMDVLDLSEQRTQVALRSGSALFDVGAIPSGGLFEVATPCGAVDAEQPGLYQVVINENGNAVATALSGTAQIVGQNGSHRIEKGENLAVSCDGSSAAELSRVDANQAGTVVDNYYRYRYPKKYDGRYRSYYTYLDNPYYYDPARMYSGYNYVSDYIPGIDDLDDYGDWQYVNNYGYCWHPHTYTGWEPYQSGYWETDYPYGLTWVSDEPWGYAPYHYGRWTYVSNDWYWVPDSVSVYPTYSPALVAFFPIGNSSVGWVALGPGDPYSTTYYDPYWQPQYTYPSTNTVVVDRVVNYNVPGAVTVVPTQDFGRVIDPRMVTRVDPQTLAQVRPVLDPLRNDSLRNDALRTRDARPRVDVPAQLAQRFANTPVLATNLQTQTPFKRDLNAMRVQQLSGRAARQQLQVTDRRGQVAQQAAPPQNNAANQPNNIAAEQAREKQMADLSRQAARGDRNARQQMLDLRRQQTAPQNQAQTLPGGGLQGERVSQAMQQQQAQRANLRQQQQAQRDSARQQMLQSQQQRAAERQQQVQSQRQAIQTQRAQERAARNSQQQQVLRSQAPVRQRPQPQYQRQAQPRMIAPQPQNQRRTAPQIMRQPQVQAQPRPQPQPQMQRQVTRQPQVQAQPRPQPQMQRQVMRPPQVQAQPRPQPQVQHQAAPKQQPPQQQPQQKGGGKKKP